MLTKVYFPRIVVPASTVIVSLVDFIIVGDYDNTLFLVEDYDYWLRVSFKHRLSSLDRDLYEYRLHENSLTMLHPREIPRLHVLTLLRNLPRMQWMSRDLSVITRLNTASALKEGHEWAGALRAFWRAVSISFLKSVDLSFRIRRNGRHMLFDVVTKLV
jgi:hypothetical protein